MDPGPAQRSLGSVRSRRSDTPIPSRGAARPLLFAFLFPHWGDLVATPGLPGKSWEQVRTGWKGVAAAGVSASGERKALAVLLRALRRTRAKGSRLVFSGCWVFIERRERELSLSFNVDHCKSLHWICCNIPSVLCFFFFLARRHCRILAPQLGIEPAPPALEGKILTTGSLRKFQRPLFVWFCLCCLETELIFPQYHHCVPSGELLLEGNPLWGGCMSPSVFSEGLESLLLCQPGISPGEDMSCLVDPGQSTPMLCSCWEGWRGVGRRGQGWTVRAGIVPWGLSDLSVFWKSRKTH